MALLNHLVDREQITELTEDESDIKGMIKADRKTIVEIVEDEKSRNEKGINVNSEDTVKNCHNGHPQLSSANIGLLKMFDEPKPEFVKEGSEILILGSAWIGEEPHWFQGELKEAPEPIVIKDRNNIIMAKCMEIHKPLLYNYWAEACSIKVEKPISVIIDKGLLEELELIITGQDPEKSRNSNDISVINEKEEQIFEGLEIIFGIEIKTELDKAEDMLTKNDMKIEVTLDTEVSQPGEGFSMFGNKEEQITNKSILAEIRMIIEKNSEGEIAVTRTFLNNVPRRFAIDLCANSSFILNTKDPERHRRFRILRSKMKCIDTETEITGIYYPEDINYEDSNKNHNTLIVQKIEDVTEEPMPGIEVRISLKDIWKGLKQCEDILDNGNDITAVTFMLEVEGPGTGNLPDECTNPRTSMKTIKGKVSLILSISEHDDIEIIRCFLNGIRREMLIEPESLKSILFITEKPWRNRRFSIENRIDNNDYLEEDD